MRGTRTLFVAFALVMAFACSSAIAAPISGVRALTVPTGGSTLVAFDGSDLYWSYSKYVSFSNGLGADTYVRRTSFLDGTTVPIYHSSAAKGESIDYIDAGGGVVALGISIDGENADHTEAPLATTVIRLNRDGGDQQTIATGKMKFTETRSVVAEGRKARLNDCGTAVELSAVTSAGEVFYAQNDKQRASKGCGGMPNVNNWSYNGLALTGVTRTILSIEAPLHANFKLFKHGGIEGNCDCGGAGHRDISVMGNWALVQTFSSASVLNISSGALAGPYKLQGIKTLEDTYFSIDSAGRVIAHGDTLHRVRRHKRVIRTAIFPVPGDPFTSVRVAGDPNAISCGDNFYSTTMSKKQVLTVNQLDPNTGAISRIVGQIDDKAGLQLWGCGGGFMYVGRDKGIRSEIRAIPLS